MGRPHFHDTIVVLFAPFACARSIVFSGDTTADDRLIAFARDADVLIHEVMHVPSIDSIVASLAKCGNRS
jgi:ribonuclease BN (tRNA processing enzyme)